MAAWREEIPRFMWEALKKTAKLNPDKVTYLASVKASDLARQAIILMDHADLIDQHPYNFAETLSEKDKALFCEVVWEWATQGVLRLSAAQSNGWEAFYAITRYGLEALKGDPYEPTPHDPEGYVQALTERVGELDPVALQYLQEALQTFRHGAMRATMVMLGGASERLLLLLCETIYPGIKTERSISQVWADVRKEHARLSPADAKAIRSSVGDDWEERLESGFQVIRRSRNEAGHPAIVSDVSRFDARFRFFTFYFYTQTVYGLLKHRGH